MVPLAEVSVPGELVAAVALAIGALVYVVRTLVSRRASPEEQVRIAILEVVRTIDRRLREVYLDQQKIPRKATDCPWSEGRIPEHYARFVKSLVTELENDRLRGEHRRDAP